MSDEPKKGDSAFARKMKKEHENHIRKAVAVKARALTIFEELMKLPEFMQWMKDNIVIRDEIDEVKKQITTYVIYIGDHVGEIEGENPVIEKHEENEDDDDNTSTN